MVIKMVKIKFLSKLKRTAFVLGVIAIGLLVIAILRNISGL